jgi:signal transduction histidine kinase
MATEVCVRDHGPGVPEDLLDTIFDPFTHTGEARERDSGGFGLGLAIARRAMQSYGGDATAANLICQSVTGLSRNMPGYAERKCSKLTLQRCAH